VKDSNIFIFLLYALADRMKFKCTAWSSVLKWLIRLPYLSHCSEEGQEKAADQVRKSQREAAEGLQSRHPQDQAAAAADPSERPAPEAALPVLRGAQTPQHATQQRAQVPKTTVNPS
jgi:hypothetical protein